MPTRAKLILASASPRRAQLLREAGYDFAIIPSQVDESAFAAGEPLAHARRLAQAKAQDVAVRHPDRLVIGADTLVDLDGEIIGKPVDAADAERITRTLFSRPHRVITGLALRRIQPQVDVLDAEVTTVYPRALTEAQIAEHIRGGTWEGKAGAYAIQEGADAFVDHLEGSFTNVVGLPLELLARRLREIPDL